jgi:GNAT superfamily N-acetyltransferase
MTIVYRDALEADLPTIVQLLADDPLGAQREDASVPLLPAYLAAFQAIATLDHQRLVVAVDGERIVGTMQFLVVPGLSMRGANHGYIEAVRIVADLRGRGEGERFVRWAVAQCRDAGCGTVQLVSEGSRTAAHRFWQKCGFVPSHVGFKMRL